MRPLHVLSLVIIAVAALLFALVALDGNPNSETPEIADTSSVLEPRDEAPAPAANLVAPAATPKLDEGEPTSSRRTIPLNDERTSVGRAAESYDNSLTGTVYDPEGLPVEGASLLLTEGGIESGMAELQRAMGTLLDTDLKKRSTKTDAEGRYSFKSIDPGNYSLVTTHPDFSENNDPIVPILLVGETPWDVRLREGVMLHGYVHSIAGPPVPNATLTLSSSMTPGILPPKSSNQKVPGSSVQTNAEGYYRFLNLTPGSSWHLSVSAAEYGTQAERNLTIEEKNGINTVDFRLQPGESLSGRVLSADRSPVEGALVRAVGYQQPQTLSAETLTDAEGRFNITNLVPGGYVLIAQADGWRTERINRVEAPSSNIEFELAEQGTVMGRVVGLSGEPVTRFTLSLHQYIANSTAFGRKIKEEKFETEDGMFTMTGVDEGRFSFKASAAGFADTFSEDFEVTQGLTTTDVLVRMSKGGMITGLVLDSTTGEPLAGAIVSTQENNFQNNPLYALLGSSMPRKTTPQRTRTGKDGRFELSMLSPELYQVQIQHPSFPLVTLNDLRVANSVPTDIGTVRLEPGSTVRGTVFDGAGQPLSGASITLLSSTEDMRLHLEGRSNAEGRYVLYNVPEGSYRLTAQRPSTGGDPFGPIVDMKNSEVQIRVGRGQEYSQDLNLGGRGR